MASYSSGSDVIAGILIVPINAHACRWGVFRHPSLCSAKMAEHKLGMEVSELLQQRIPEARKQLRDSHKNLHDLADYCERNYIETGQSTQALEETKKYAAQSLASVAYQVNMLATGMLDLLDKQMEHLGEMEASVSHISQVC